MRVLIVCASNFPPNEGLGFHAWNLARHLQKEGAKVEVCTRGGPLAFSRHQIEGFTVHRVPFVPIYPFHLWLHGLALQRAVANLEPDFDLVHVHSPVVPALRTRLPLVATFHSALRHDVKHTKVTSLASVLVKLQGPFSVWHEERLLQRADAVTAVSTQVASVLKNYRAGPTEVRVIPNAVCPEDFPAYFGPRREGSFLSAGRIAPAKGIEDLLALAERLPEFRFRIAGAGPLGNSLRAHWKHLKNVEWLGHIDSREKMRELYQEASALLMTSHLEGFPTVLLEAMASGCPVLATDVGGIPELVEDGISGRLLKVGDFGGWEQMLRKFSPAQAQKHAMEARRRVESLYSWQRVGGQYLDLYHQVLPRLGDQL